jgi:hypothetical protein
MSRPWARITGIVYLLYFVLAISGESLRARGHFLYGDIGDVFSFACYAAVTLLLYNLFKPVSNPLSALAALLSLAGCGISVLALFKLVPPPLSPLLFFGPYCLLIGYLVLRSTFLPRFLGVLMVLAGLGWLAYLSPLAHYLSLEIKIVGILAEGSLMLWLLVMGVNVARWKKQASLSD